MLNSVADFDDDPILSMEETGELWACGAKTWPDSNFCGNALLAMIYRCRAEDLPREYREVSAHLETVLDEGAPDIDRARSVRLVARWLEHNNQDTGHSVWTELSVDVGHPESVYEQTLAKLSCAGYQIVTAVETELLPSIQDGVGRPDWSYDPLDALLCHINDLPLIMKSGAPGWSPTELRASIQIIVLFFIFSIKVFAPGSPDYVRRRATRFRPSQPTTQKEDDWACRAHALREQLGWLEPVWFWLIDEYSLRKTKSQKGRSFDDERRRLHAQREAMKLFLKNLASAHCEDELWFQYSQLSDEPEQHVVHEAPMQEAKEDLVLLVKGQIPAASEKWEVESLKRYSCLLEPLRSPHRFWIACSRFFFLNLARSMRRP